MSQIYNNKGQVIGCVVGNTLHKGVQGSKHFLHTPPAIALDAKAVQQAQDMGVDVVDVVDTETKILYSTTIDILWKRGIRINRGHSKQIALPFKWWTEDNPAQIQMFEEV